MGVDIAQPSRVVLVVEENRKESTSMAKKRANGEGSIRKRKDGRWEAVTRQATLQRANPSTGTFWAEPKRKWWKNSTRPLTKPRA